MQCFSQFRCILWNFFSIASIRGPLISMGVLYILYFKEHFIFAIFGNLKCITSATLQHQNLTCQVLLTYTQLYLIECELASGVICTTRPGNAVDLLYSLWVAHTTYDHRDLLWWLLFWSYETCTVNVGCMCCSVLSVQCVVWFTNRW